MDSCSKPFRKQSRRAKDDMYFTVRLGGTETRANSVRPLDGTIRSFYLATTVMCGSIGVGPWIPIVMPFLFSEAEREITLGHYIWGIGFPMVAGLSLAIYLLDCISRWALSRMSVPQIRRRLAKNVRSGKYVMKDRHLRGAKIGAWFFASIATASFGALLIRWVFM